MKYSVHDYAKALDGAVAAPKANDAAIAKNFLALIRRNGDESRLEKILDEAARLARGKHGVREVTIESARPLTASQESAAKNFLKSGDMVNYAIDPTLVAGVRIIMNDETQFDGSLKSKLDTLFNA